MQLNDLDTIPENMVFDAAHSWSEIEVNIVPSKIIHENIFGPWLRVLFVCQLFGLQLKTIFLVIIQL